LAGLELPEGPPGNAGIGGGATPPGAQAGPATGRETERRRSGLRAVGETLFIVAAAFVLALIIQAFVVKSYVIPTPSMVPTLMEGDRVMVNRFIFRFTEPKRGDVIVFQTDLRKDPLIKRVVVVGGDRIAVHDGKLYLNGEAQVEPQLNEPVMVGEFKEITVPAGEFFMMGDNRNDSGDSRMFGPIKRSVILGRAFLRFWPLNRLHWL
jgi:signal peptidase I